MLNYDKDPIKFPIIYDNKFGIDNLEKLLKKEAKCTLFRESEIIKKDLFLKGPFDLKHLQSIHKHLFQDVYPWAGQIRDGDITKSNVTFCHFRYIESAMQDVIKQIKSFDKKNDVKEVANHLAYVSNELNAIHPFREGNGRSKRVFLDRYALSMGYDLNLQNISAEELKQLEINVYHTNNLTSLTNRLMGVMQKVQQQQEVSPALKSMQAGARKVQKDMQRGQSNQKANLKQNGGNYMG